MTRTKTIIYLLRAYFSYISGKIKTGYPPLKLWIETSSRCNLACSICLNKDLEQNQKGDMDFNLYREIIDEAKDFVFEVNLFHRGEPLMHPAISDMVGYAHKNNIKTCIHTNGVLMDNDIGSKLIKAGLTKISFSFDNCDMKAYEENRSGADFEKTLENITGFLALKKQLKSKTPFTIIQLMETEDELGRPGKQKIKKNQEIKYFVERFGSTLPDRFTVRKMHNWGGNLKTGASYDKNPVIKTCTFPWYSLTVFFNGKVYLCPQDFRGEICIGDLNKQSIKEVFNSEKVCSLRKDFKNKIISGINPCSACDRIRRSTRAGVPPEYLKSFLEDILRKT